ncbi:MAG: DUF2341 domain-containing protein [Betaproteobacteria bacterium]|nr:DUF2341 domain-containing protein [Betaproteobacteria bacterium]
MRRVVLILAAMAMLWPALSLAWWNADWTGRKKIELDTSPQGAGISAAVSNAPVLIRLHTGNFAFAEAQLDGNDLRFVAEDDKTPLKYHIESFDATNELALIWVQVPSLQGGAVSTFWMYYGNDKAPAAGDAKSTYDSSYLAVVHFSEKDAAYKDSTAYSAQIATTGVVASGAGVADGAAAFNGSAKLVFPSAPAMKTGPAGFTFSAWVKPGDPNQSASLFARGQSAAGVDVRLEQGKLFVRAFGGESGKVDLAPSAWHHVVVTFADRVLVYLDGAQVASAEVKTADLDGDIVVGSGYVGDMDELQLANAARPDSWVKAQLAAQGDAGKLTRVSAEAETEEGGGDASYFRILLGAVTLDGWIVIGILLVMMVISFFVMVSKGVFLVRMDGANKAFQKKFSATDDILAVEGESASSKHSSLFRLHQTASTELRRRLDGGAAALSDKSIEAIRASLDATTVRENARLNSQMVLLTIAISGGPFLGLLGTVVGVMITFAAIAAAGDVNVNSIAPGIAAALVATVAGLGVAIPALFGYNYLASRIKNISADMQVFVDEVVSRIAERYVA